MARRTFRRFGMRRKRRVCWVTSLFNETALPVDATAPALQLMLAGADWMLSEGSTVSGGVQKVGRVVRAIFKGTINLIPSITTVATESVNGFWCAYVADSEDTDSNDLNTTAGGTILSSNRVIGVGHFGSTIIEVPTAQIGNFVSPGFPIDLDVRTRINMRTDDFLLMGVQLQGGSGSVLSSATVSGISRVLIEEP